MKAKLIVECLVNGKADKLLFRYLKVTKDNYLQIKQSVLNNADHNILYNTGNSNEIKQSLKSSLSDHNILYEIVNDVIDNASIEEISNKDNFAKLLSKARMIMDHRKINFRTTELDPKICILVILTDHFIHNNRNNEITLAA